MMTEMPFLKGTGVAVCIGLVLGWPCLHARAQNAWTPDAISRQLRYQESLVQSMECIYEQCVLPTPPDQIPLIRQVCAASQVDFKRSWERYVYDDAMAQKRRKVVHWWRKGAMERLENYPAGPLPREGRLQNVTAFDGHIVRSLTTPEGSDPYRGSIDTIQGSHWHAENRIQPYSFLYEYHGIPYSKVIAEAQEFSATPVTKEGQELTEVCVKVPGIETDKLVLIFDRDFRLRERRIIVGPPLDATPQVWERHVYSDYREIIDRSGEKIWFPWKAAYHYYVGELPDGTPVEYMTEVVDVKEAKFNVEIPESYFVISFPPGTQVWDGIAGLGWIDEHAEKIADKTLMGMIDDSLLRKTVARPQGQGEEEPIPASQPDIVPASDLPKADKRQMLPYVRRLLWVGALVAGLVLALAWLVPRSRMGTP